jgi:hypothetical protein
MKEYFLITGLLLLVIASIIFITFFIYLILDKIFDLDPIIMYPILLSVLLLYCIIGYFIC